MTTMTDDDDFILTFTDSFGLHRFGTMLYPASPQQSLNDEPNLALLEGFDQEASLHAMEVYVAAANPQQHDPSLAIVATDVTLTVPLDLDANGHAAIHIVETTPSTAARRRDRRTHPYRRPAHGVLPAPSDEVSLWEAATVPQVVPTSPSTSAPWLPMPLSNEDEEDEEDEDVEEQGPETIDLSAPVELGDLHRTPHNTAQTARLDQACTAASSGLREDALSLLHGLIKAHASYVVRKMLDHLLADPASLEGDASLPAYSSRNKGFLRALGYGALLVEHLRNSPEIPVTATLITELRTRFAPPASARIPSSTDVSNLCYRLACPLPQMPAIDACWIGLVPAHLSARFRYEVLKRLPGRWCDCYAAMKKSN